MRTQTWEISNEFWELVKLLIPTQKELRDETKEYRRNVGAGRKPKYNARTYFSVIVYVLKLVRFIVLGKPVSANTTNLKESIGNGNRLTVTKSKLHLLKSTSDPILRIGEK